MTHDPSNKIWQKKLESELPPELDSLIWSRIEKDMAAIDAQRNKKSVSSKVTDAEPRWWQVLIPVMVMACVLVVLVPRLRGMPEQAFGLARVMTEDVEMLQNIEMYQELEDLEYSEEEWEVLLEGAS